ncbi:hypothetical protein ACFFWC_06255 [Plantactinospora siamensis]|uniref:Uncharacterized protein n=1 Tax=Plantactinospora siamensis TaxID=555372 RepID=A0ABV6NWR5_9ACTN
MSQAADALAAGAGGPGHAPVLVLPAVVAPGLRDRPLAGSAPERHVAVAVSGLAAAAAGPAEDRPVLVVAGDAALITAAELDMLLARHAAGASPVTRLRGLPPTAAPDGTDRADAADRPLLAELCREALADADADGRSVAWVLDPEPAAAVRAALTAVDAGDDPVRRVGATLAAGGWPAVEAVARDWRSAVRITDAAGYGYAARVLRDRVLRDLVRIGVVITDPDSTWVDPGVRVAPDAVLGPRTQLSGNTSIGAGARIGPDVSLTDTTVGAGAEVRYAICTGAEIGARAIVGPWTYLRHGTRLGADAGAGCFVELKGTVVGDRTMVPHFACLIDGDIGSRCNIAAFTGLANFDGVAKHRAVIGDDVLVAAGTAVMAPARLGDGAMTAAGTVVTRDVPPGALAIARVSQVNVEGWVESRLPESRSAVAARRALENERKEPA